jgi:Cft2 family RNA processing exonuclease
MKLTFLGANHEVTGSCTLLEAAGQRYLIGYYEKHEFRSPETMERYAF